jgi:S-adenosylmethionine decarboxylase
MDLSKSPIVGKFRGTHLLGELYDVPSHVLDDDKHLQQVLLEAIPHGTATVLGVQSKKFEPVGVTILILLAESHASIHTYPENKSLFLDIFTCGDCKPMKIFEYFVNAINAEQYSVKQIKFRLSSSNHN